MANKGYTQEQREWLIKNVNLSHLDKEFEKQFGIYKCDNTLRSALRDWGYRVDVPLNINGGEGGRRVKGSSNLTKEQENFIINNYKNYPDYKSLLDAYNKEFHTNKNIKFIYYYISQLHLQKYTKTTKVAPIGHIRNKKNRIQQLIKYTNTYSGKDAWKNYMPLTKYLYEQYHNVKLSSKDVVIYADGDNKNITKENLILCSLNQLSTIVSKNWYGKGILTKAGIEILKTQDALNEFENYKGEKNYD